jgi:hypothetical protein
MKKDIENRQYEIKFKADYEAYSKRKQLYESNTTKAYARKIEANKKFESEIFENPIKLLEIIKKIV